MREGVEARPLAGTHSCLTAAGEGGVPHASRVPPLVLQSSLLSRFLLCVVWVAEVGCAVCACHLDWLVQTGGWVRGWRGEGGGTARKWQRNGREKRRLRSGRCGTTRVGSQLGCGPVRVCVRVCVCESVCVCVRVRVRTCVCVCLFSPVLSGFLSWLDTDL